MELLIIIVQEVDYGRLSREFIKHKILATKFTTEGLYLNKKSITLMVCIEKEREEEILEYQAELYGTCGGKAGIRIQRTDVRGRGQRCQNRRGNRVYR